MQIFRIKNFEFDFLENEGFCNKILIYMYFPFLFFMQSYVPRGYVTYCGTLCIWARKEVDHRLFLREPVDYSRQFVAERAGNRRPQQVVPVVSGARASALVQDESRSSGMICSHSRH